MPIDIEKDDIQTALKKLKARENTLNLVEKLNNLGSWEVDLVTKKSYWSKNSYIIYEYAPFSFTPNLETFFSHLSPSDLQRAKTKLNELVHTNKPSTFETKVTLKSGKVKIVRINAQTIYDENGTPTKLIGTTQDITQQVALEVNSYVLGELVENSSNEIYIIDYATDKILFANKGACNALGYTKEELLELTIYDINTNLTPKKVQKLKEHYENNTTPIMQNETIHMRKDGSTYYVQSHIQEFLYNGSRAYAIFDTDISQQVQDSKLLLEQSKQLYHQANHDSLTNLPNRVLFRDRLDQACTYAKRNSSKVALLFIDLDNFKDINDSLGHHIGDEVLQEISKRLLHAIRESDTLARLGGDEFTIILNDIHNKNDIIKIAQHLLASMQEPVHIASYSLHVSISIGISVYPDDTQVSEDLIKFADTAMYKTKESGKNNFHFYTKNMTEKAFKKVVMENSLKIAIKEEAFVVHYQPQYNALTNELIGMEALVRWSHKELGLIPPNEFIPLAEELGLIVALDRIVMKQAVKQFTQWCKDGFNPGKLSLNLAMAQLNQPDFISYLLEIINTYDFDINRLELEVTETQIMQNPELSIKKLQLINTIGIDIVLDDFGTGYSSLSYLKKLPLSKLKIDQSFVRDLPDDEDDAAITKTIIAMGKSFQLNLIAEGVETKEQKEFLLKAGCIDIQGYLYSKPIPADDITTLLTSLKTNET